MDMHGVLLAIPDFTFIQPGTALYTMVEKTFVTFQIAGFPATPYTLTLIGLMILFILAIAVNGITERLAGAKVGNVTMALIVTILGSAIASAYVLLPIDFEIEGVRIIAALLGGLVISVFYTLLRAAAKSGGGGAKH
jgi:hypothetical protein